MQIWQNPYNREEQEHDYAPPYSNPRDALGSTILMLTDPEDELFNFELVLRSCRIGENNQPIRISPEKKPLVNDFGAVCIIGTVQSIANQLYIMGMHDKGTIRQLMEFAGDEISRDLMTNKSEYGIARDADRDRIHFMSLCTIYGCLCRGLDEGERRFWKGSVMEMKQSMETPKKESMFSKFWNKT